MTVADRKQREKERRRAEIVSAAENLFYAKGFDNVTMDEIADAVEISKGLLYVYFKNKDSLFFAIVARKRWESTDILTERLKNTATGGERVRAIIQWYVDITKGNPEFSEMASTYAPLLWSRLDRENEAALTEDVQPYYALLNAAIRDGIEDGTVRDDMDPVMLGYYITLISMAVAYPLPSWKKIFALAGIPFDQFLDSFSRFIDPSINGCPQKNTERTGNRSKTGKPGEESSVKRSRDDKKPSQRRRTEWM
jgi:AcrR family transcriptional regulator